MSIEKGEPARGAELTTTPGPSVAFLPHIPGWALVSAASAPVLLIGGWSLAAARQPAGYSAIRDTISALAAHGAHDRWVMTSALAGLGACHLVTAAGLTPARTAGRLLLGGGGLATVLVAAFPQPAHGDSVAHTVAATSAFAALALWPAFAWRRRPGGPLLSRARSLSATVVLASLAVWFAAELGLAERGLAERMAAGAQAIWPLLVVLTTRRAQARSRRST